MANKRYKSRQHPNFTNDFEILKNPDFEESKWHVKHWFLYDVIKAIITAGLSIISGFALFQLKADSQSASKPPAAQELTPLKGNDTQAASLRNSTLHPLTDTGKADK